MKFKRTIAALALATAATLGLSAPASAAGLGVTRTATIEFVAETATQPDNANTWLITNTSTDAYPVTFVVEATNTTETVTVTLAPGETTVVDLGAREVPATASVDLTYSIFDKPLDRASASRYDIFEGAYYDYATGKKVSPGVVKKEVILRG